MNAVPAHWSIHSRPAVNDQVKVLLDGIVIPDDVTADVRCLTIQACAHIAINLICDLADALPGSDPMTKAKDALDGIKSLNSDMVTHIIRRFAPKN